VGLYGAPRMRTDFCIVGGGIVGHATALALLERRPRASLILLEKETDLAAHQTGHNSGVIHAGVYYAPGSLKARLCRAGNRQTRDFCREQGIRFELCGKLIVATNAAEATRLEALRERCTLNLIEAEPLDGTRLRELEPRIAGQAGLLVASSGIYLRRGYDLPAQFANPTRQDHADFRIADCGTQCRSWIRAGGI
jgi:L-2-hydroxyglutarate oxidase